MINALLGMLILILFSTPVGSTIVACDLAVFVIVYVLSLLKGRRG